MAISQTTFDQRLSRINKTANGSTFGLTHKSRKAGSKGSKFTFPFFVGVGILTGGTAYAWAAQAPEYQWIIAFAG